jgi:hypothetical protein
LPDAYRGAYGSGERHSTAARVLEDAAHA